MALSLAAGTLQSRGYLPAESILAVLFGIAIGPHGFGILPQSVLSNPLFFIEQLALVTVAFAVTSIALRLPATYFRRHAVSMAALLGPGMLVMWLASGFVTYALLPVPFWVALLIGAAITPTDPVLANSIVVGETAAQNIPERIRFLLSAEAGANDGWAHPFVVLAILLLTQPLDVALATWTTETILLEVLGAIGFGLAVGAGVGRLEDWLSNLGLMEETSVLTVTVALTFTVLGSAELLGFNGILAVFAAGITYNWQSDPQDEVKEQQVEEVFNRLFTIPVFVIFGMVLPWSEWTALGLQGLALVVAVLLVRRLPMVFALRPAIRPLNHPADTLFVGWFGPIGITALFYATLAVRETGSEIVWTVASLVVAGSILAHGATSTLFTLRYGKLMGDAEAL
ncbi:MAG: cation:proton antiporter [Halobacteriota archaeon]